MLVQSTSLSSSLSNECIIPSQRFINFSRDPFRGFLAPPIRAIIIHFHLVISMTRLSSVPYLFNRDVAFEQKRPNYLQLLKGKIETIRKSFPFSSPFSLRNHFFVVFFCKWSFKIKDQSERNFPHENEKSVILIHLKKSRTIISITLNKFSKYSFTSSRVFSRK